jgi:transcriptional regulator with XRE-family HTH domain
MKARGLTQSAVSRALNLSQASVSAWMDKSLPHPRTMQALADLLRVELDWLVSGAGPMERPGAAADNPRLAEAAARVARARKELDEAARLLEEELKAPAAKMSAIKPPPASSNGK